MKKSILAFLFIFVFAVTASCSKKVDYYKYVSEVRSVVLSGENDRYFVKVFAGQREYPLIADGKPDEMKYFVTVKLDVLSEEKMLLNDLSVAFSTDKDYAGTFTYRPEAESYVVNFKVNEIPAKELTLTVKNGDDVSNVTLSDAVGKSVISPIKALDAATKYKAAYLNEIVAESRDLEISIRLMTQDTAAYYYVGFIENQTTTALLVSADGKVLAEKRLKNQ